jgi:multisubunit Na+/H+ antiporter MnhG subunit
MQNTYTRVPKKKKFQTMRFIIPILGIRQLRLAKLRDMQIKLLISLYFQTNADTFVENILSKNSL